MIVLSKKKKEDIYRFATQSDRAVLGLWACGFHSGKRNQHVREQSREADFHFHSAIKR